MYRVYLKEESSFDSKKMLGEYADIDDAYDVIDAEVAKNKDVKYILEELSGKVDIYGELIPRIVEEN